MRERVVIITGPMRSGTTLLGNMLHGGHRARHPNLSFAPDTVTDLRDVTPIAARETGQALPLMNVHVNADFLVRWTQIARAALPAFKAKVLAVAPAPTPTVYGGKLTGLLPELIALSAMEGLEVKTLILERDPRDIFASALKRYGDGGESAALAFMNAALTLDYQAAKIPNSMRVSYERLVTHPKETLSAVLAFIGLNSDVYDWSALENGLISNSSFSGIGPNDLVAGSGVQPSIGRHANLDAFHRAALAEFLSVGPRANLETRLRLYEHFLPEVISVAARYDYAMHGLKSAAKQRIGVMIRLILAAKAIARKATRTWF